MLKYLYSIKMNENKEEDSNELDSIEEESTVARQGMATVKL